MSKTIKFFYTYCWLEQRALLEDMPDFRVKDEVGDGHISLDGVILCGTNADLLKKENKADGYFTVAAWRKGVNICPKCQSVWKSMPKSPWKAWEEQVAHE